MLRKTRVEPTQREQLLKKFLEFLRTFKTTFNKVDRFLVEDIHWNIYLFITTFNN